MATATKNIAASTNQAPLKVIPNDPVPRDEAIYLASLNPGFCEDVYANSPDRNLPPGLNYADLNPLDPASKLFYSPYVMTSAGQALGDTKPCIIKNRNQTTSLVLADSGGYAVASGGLVVRGDNDRRKILRWQEAVGDVCFTLDHPTKQRGDTQKTPKSQADCLAATLEHLRYYQAKRRNPNIYWLNCLQGNDIAFADIWYDQVKAFDFQSFAFAGPLRHNFHLMMRRLLQMMNEKRLENIKWLHVLGTSEIETALMLSVIQRSINKYVSPGLRISFDTGAPSRMLNWNEVYTGLSVDGGKMTTKQEAAPEGPEYLGSSEPWPWPSVLGKRLTMGDVTQSPSYGDGTYRDTQSNNYLVHMNLTTLCQSIAEANQRFKEEQATGHHTFAVHVARAAEAIDEIFRSGGSRALLHAHRGRFAALRRG